MLAPVAGRTHLFFAMSHFAFGEVALALRLAWQLHDRGDRVVFLTPSGISVLFERTPFKHGEIDAVWGAIDQVVPEVAAEHRCDSVVVVDAASLYLALHVARRSSAFLRELSMPVIAFDVWNLPETNLAWDTGPEVWRLPPEAAAFAHRLCPVPFIRPDPAPGRYNALPAPAHGDRERVRSELGLATGDQLLLTTTASWQHALPSDYHRHLVEVVPPLVLSHLSQLDSRVRVLHVGPQALVDAHVLGSRYKWLPRVNAERMMSLLVAADLCVTLNAAATTISSAIALDLPVVLGINSHSGQTAESLAMHVESPRTRAMLPRLAPLMPFAVWPLGLHTFLAPVLRDNPYLDAVSTVELLDEDAFVSTCQRLLAEPAEARSRMARYRALVANLPTAADVFESYL